MIIFYLRTLSLILFFSLNSCNEKSRNSSYKKSSGQSQTSANLSPVEHFLSAREDIKELHLELESEQERQDLIMKELVSNVGAGCMFDTLATNVEVIVNGKKEKDLDVSKLKQTDQYLKEPDPSKTMFEFYLGNNSQDKAVRFMNNEKTNPLFQNNGDISYNVPEGKELPMGEIEWIYIKKFEPVYNQKNFCPKNEDGESSPDCQVARTIHETERYLMEDLKIKVNGFLFYEKSSTHHMFSTNSENDAKLQSQGLSWEDKKPQLNDAFIKILQRTDCPTD